MNDVLYLTKLMVGEQDLRLKNSEATQKNIGAKVFSAKFAQVPNLLTTTLISCLCNAIEPVAESGGITHTTTNTDVSGCLR